MRIQWSILIVLGLTTIQANSDEINLQINLNKPINDVSDNFISFSIKPEILLELLNGDKKDMLTQMASNLSPSNLKIMGDFAFATRLQKNIASTLKDDEFALAVWDLFNEWTRVMNWKMIIPVPYKPQKWNPLDALMIMNISSAIGIDNCIWQLGLDFESTDASTYVADLKTLKTISDAFGPFVRDWNIVGADITAGSSPDETKLYVDMSKRLTIATGWTQPVGYHVEQNINGYIYEKDLALRAILAKNEPTWLSLPSTLPASKNMRAFSNIQKSEGLQWAQTLGDAANYGFHVVYKPIEAEDIEKPTFGYYITLFFKKLMGNKVFATKVLSGNGFTSKLFSHCANGKSGGIALMGINTEECATVMNAKTSIKFTGSEIWQYILNVNNGVVYLNGNPLNLNSTLEPFVKIKQTHNELALKLPAMSVGFWILPLANHDECIIKESKGKTYSKKSLETKTTKTTENALLQILIAENSLAGKGFKYSKEKAPFGQAVVPSLIVKTPTSTNVDNKIDVKKRQRRFILEDSQKNKMNTVLSELGIEINLADSCKDKTIQKRENEFDAWHWIKAMMNPFNFPSHSRSRRSINSLFGGLFRKDKSEKQPSQVDQEKILKSTNSKGVGSQHKSFDEEKFFTTSKVDPTNFPKSDVHIKVINGLNGEIDGNAGLASQEVKQTLYKMEPKYLPASFYESEAVHKVTSSTKEKPTKVNNLPLIWNMFDNIKQPKYEEKRPNDRYIEVITPILSSNKNNKENNYGIYDDLLSLEGYKVDEIDFLKRQKNLLNNFYKNNHQPNKDDVLHGENVRNYNIREGKNSESRLKKYFNKPQKTEKYSPWYENEDANNRYRRDLNEIDSPLSWEDNTIFKEIDDKDFGVRYSPKNIAEVKLMQDLKDDNGSLSTYISKNLKKIPGVFRIIKKQVINMVGIVTEHLSGWLNQQPMT